MESKFQNRNSLKIKVATAMMITLTVIMALTPIGTIRLPMVSVTTAHIPILISTILLGFSSGFFVALSFGIMSLILALTTPTAVLSPFFVNPLISIFPRLLIPVTTYFTYKTATKLFSSLKFGNTLSIALSVAVGNLTNTFAVYTMLYFVYAQEIFEKTGQSALNYIMAAMAISTFWKCVIIVLAVVPLIRILQKSLRY